MTDFKPDLKSFTFWQRFIRIGVLLWVGWKMSDDVYMAITGIWNYLKNGFPISAQAMNSILSLLLGGTFFAITYLVYIFWFAQFVLPVASSAQRIMAFKRLLLFGISLGRGHGPAIFVRNGDIIGTSEENEKRKPGVAFLDLRSAMSLDTLLDKENNRINDRSPTPQRVHFFPFRLDAYPRE
jgi:hypothetical protein